MVGDESYDVRLVVNNKYAFSGWARFCHTLNLSVNSPARQRTSVAHEHGTEAVSPFLLFISVG